MTKKNIMETPCPHCGKIITVIGCSTCRYSHRNYFNYDEAKKCWECDMLHRNYEEDEGILE